MMKNYSMWHTMCTLGNTDIHTLRLILFCSSIEECASVKSFKWAAPDETKLKIGYTKSFLNMIGDRTIKLYFSYPPSCEAIEVKTKQSHELKKQCVQIQPNPSSTEDWYHFADIDLKHTNFASFTIQIDIAHNTKNTDNTLPNLHNLLMDPTSSDATIESCDGVTLNVHECILTARSDVFKAHFTDSSTSAIKSNFEEAVLKELLNFIYSGIKAVNMDSVADRLFVAAEYYQLNDLKNFCECALYKQLTEDNVIDILMLADLHSAVDLKNLAMDFVDSNASIVFTKPDWANLKSSKILKNLYEYTQKIIEHMTDDDGVE